MEQIFPDNPMGSPTLRWEGGPIPLSPLQGALRDALNEKDPKWADIYYGALYVLEQKGNPERFSQCAQSMRELVDKLAFVEKGPSMKTKVQDLKSAWEKMKRKGNGTPSPENREEFVELIENFFTWVDSNRASRKNQAVKVINGLDLMMLKLPEPIMQLRAEEYNLHRLYFEQVAHHNNYPTELEFVAYLHAFEGFLVDRLRPRTSNDFLAIERLIREGEANA